MKQSFVLTDGRGWLKSYKVGDNSKTVMTTIFSQALIFNSHTPINLNEDCFSGLYPVDVISKHQSTEQIGGEHYKKPIQAIEYIAKNSLNFNAGNVIKYISRYKDKNGLEDLNKAKHYIDYIINYEYLSSSALTSTNNQALEMQPHEYCFKNGFNSLQFEVIDKVTRHNKLGLVALRQAQKAIDTLISFEYEK